MDIKLKIIWFSEELMYKKTYDSVLQQTLSFGKVLGQKALKSPLEWLKDLLTSTFLCTHLIKPRNEHIFEYKRRNVLEQAFIKLIEYAPFSVYNNSQGLSCKCERKNYMEIYVRKHWYVVLLNKIIHIFQIIHTVINLTNAYLRHKYTRDTYG